MRPLAHIVRWHVFRWFALLAFAHASEQYDVPAERLTANGSPYAKCAQWNRANGFSFSTEKQRCRPQLFPRFPAKRHPVRTHNQETTHILPTGVKTTTEKSWIVCIWTVYYDKICRPSLVAEQAERACLLYCSTVRGKVLVRSCANTTPSS